MSAAAAPDALAALRARYLRAQLAGDRREAMRLVIEEGLGAGASIAELQAGIVQAAQDEIGRLWEANLVSIAQEHMATAISQVVLSALYERAPAPRALGRTILVACIEGERHDLPARLAADYLELEGFTVRFAGADVPHEHLSGLARAEQPDVIGLSVTMGFHLGSLRAAVARLRAVTAAPVFAGGHAIEGAPELAAELGIEVAGRTRAEVVALARRLTGLSPAAT